MLAAFKIYVMPYLVYAIVLWACGIGMTKRAAIPLFVYIVLVIFPQFWYPIQDLPLGSYALSMLALTAIIGGHWQRPKGDPTAPNRGLVIVFLLASYVALWNSSLRFGLSLPVTSNNELFPQWRNYAIMVALYFGAYSSMRNETLIRRATLLFFWVIIVLAWRELAGFASGDTFSYNRRCSGPFWMVGLNANHFAAFIAHYSVVAIGLLAMDDDKKRKRLYLAAFVVSLYPLFFSYSRGAYVAVLFAVLVVAILRYRAILPLLGIFMIFWDSLLPSSVVDRIQMTESPDGQIEESAALRLVVWALAKQLFSENPIFGIGYQGFYFASAGLPLRNVHNFFLQIAAEQGIAGALLLAVFLGRAMWSGWRLYHDGTSVFLRGMGLGFIACISAMLITNIFGDRFSQISVGSYFWILFGLVDRARVLSKTPPDTSTLPKPMRQAGAIGRRPKTP
ncbi:MAG: O-antigen ligase family protein [Aquabacterium sp.]|nr:O-antigen ligase family protein [Aquabacterium sp.]